MKFSRRFFPVFLALCLLFILLPRAWSFTNSQKEIRLFRTCHVKLNKKQTIIADQ
ncbi:MULTISPECIES: hypothetical protein [unclassified Microcystis]|uniref:hypothetical protein n=1 Tax=unclassified Microcystis TaxID=2643300 RepID=UPI0022C2E6D2|nr:MULTISPECIES: hypothetical protein [unclassified Microcystis]MCA2692667.1 hypothetical protein [Microcystis sp. M034S2]MCA2751017.1 hypothetical protein [Microcystis sp. M144S2]MCZ8201267.1 hypothetical protein [Microcystis sp. LE19-55.1A]MCZ8307605.1 hypothetical protein [Microcystis sp. LE19-98.1E]